MLSSTLFCSAAEVIVAVAVKKERDLIAMSTYGRGGPGGGCTAAEHRPDRDGKA